jgi:hypothetical protein
MNIGTQIVWLIVIGIVLSMVVFMTLEQVGIPLYEFTKSPPLFYGVIIACIFALPLIYRAIQVRRARGFLPRLVRTGLATGASVWVVTAVPEIRAAIGPEIAGSPALLIFLGVPWYLLFWHFDRDPKAKPLPRPKQAPPPPAPPKAARFKATSQNHGTRKAALAGFLDRLNPELARLIGSGINPPKPE